MAEEQDDVFDDAEQANEGAEQAPPEAEPSEKLGDEPPKEEEQQQSGEKEASKPPSEDQKEVSEPKPEKMISESRFKAALKDATDKLEAANAELAQLKTSPVPDKEADPEGYDLHIRVEASKAAMRATHEDYTEVIAHYAEMAKSNPFLNEAVAKHPVPAQYAYQLAKENLRIQKLSELEKSDDWKEFQAWKTEKAAKKDPVDAPTPKVDDISSKLGAGAAKVPNLNRATNVSKAASKTDVDDELFAGAL